MKSVVSILLVFLFTAAAVAQVRVITDRKAFQQDDIEINTSFALGTRNSADRPYDDGELTIGISASLGYYIVDGLSIEPELEMDLLYESSLSLLANLSYTISIPGKTIFPFFKVGFGKSSFGKGGYTPYYEEVSNSLFDLNSTVFSISGGIKILQSSSVALKIGLNYKKFSYKRNFYTYEEGYQSKMTSTSAITFGIGGSFLL